MKYTIYNYYNDRHDETDLFLFNDNVGIIEFPNSVENIPKDTTIAVGGIYLEEDLKQVAKHLSIAKSKFAELLVTEYPVGSVINWHRDVPQFDLIAGISLMSSKATIRLQSHGYSTRMGIGSPSWRRAI